MNTSQRIALAVAVANLALLMVFPVLYTLYLSFTNWNLITKRRAKKAQ